MQDLMPFSGNDKRARKHRLYAIGKLLQLAKEL